MRELNFRRDPGSTGGPPASPPAPPAAPPPAPPVTPPTPTYSKAEVDRMVAESIRADREAQAKKAADEKAKAQGEFEKLAESRAAEVEKLKADLAERDARELRRRVADKHKLPAELADRLRGATEAELEADAAGLAKLVPAQSAGGSGGTANPSQGRPMTREAMAELARTNPTEFNARWEKGEFRDLMKAQA